MDAARCGLEDARTDRQGETGNREGTSIGYRCARGKAIGVSTEVSQGQNGPVRHSLIVFISEPAFAAQTLNPLAFEHLLTRFGNL